jgi:hypothetical protein
MVSRKLGFGFPSRTTVLVGQVLPTGQAGCQKVRKKIKANILAQECNRNNGHGEPPKSKNLLGLKKSNINLNNSSCDYQLWKSILLDFAHTYFNRTIIMLDALIKIRTTTYQRPRSQSSDFQRPLKKGLMIGLKG